MSIEAMKQWREALRKARRKSLTTEECHAAITSIDQAIAEAEKQEPVAMQMDVIVVNLVREGINKHRAREFAEHFIKTATPQPKREWVGLTQNQINRLCEMSEIAAAVVATELLLKEKNHV
jgi:hypothetical protein